MVNRATRVPVTIVVLLLRTIIMLMPLPDADDMVFVVGVNSKADDVIFEACRIDQVPTRLRVDDQVVRAF